jgi:kinesin family protein 3/17
MNAREKAEKSTICVEVDEQNNTVSVTSQKSDTKTFQFDYVYPMDTTQRRVYDEVAFPIVDSIFQGYNGTVFAYGQTGCGKTFTMMGVVNDPNLRGVIPNAFEHIFGYIKTEGSSKRFLVRCSFVEIYNEEVRDLLTKNDKALDVREDPKKGTFVKDLSYVTLSNTKDISKCLDRGNANRHVGATSMNDQSSRSHSLFTVYLEIEEGDDRNKKIRTGKLNLVDLAGSERVGKTNATGKTFDEGKKINLSLTALGSVIDALSSNRKHIPYKDSKLTRLLSDSLGGNTKTVMFANVSPASFNYDETVGTLRYASRAKLIKNAPKVNEDPKDALLRQYEEEIKMLKAQLAGNIPIANNINNDDNEKNGNIGNDENNENQKVFNPIDDEEKKKLLEKIAMLEKGMIQDGSKVIIQKEIVGESEEEKKERLKREEEQKKKFKEYREQQIKNQAEMEKKYALLEEQKRKEEESLQNNVKKLQERIKYLNNEIEDLKYDNEKDRIDFLENIKGINKDNMLYREIIRYLLTDNELKKIIDMSRYNEEIEKWKVHPFAIEEKKLSLPTVKPSQVPTFIENNINKRRIIFSNYGDENTNKENNDNDDDVFSNDNDEKEIIPIRDANQKKFHIKIKDSNNSNLTSKKFRVTKEKFHITSRPAINEPNGFFDEDKNLSNHNTNNINMILMSQKEREKFENLTSFNLGTSLTIKNNGSSKGKVILNPIKSNFKNMEFKKNNLGVSFKASLKENDQVKNELKLSKIDENNYENSGRFIGNDDEY